MLVLEKKELEDMQNRIKNYLENEEYFKEGNKFLVKSKTLYDVFVEDFLYRFDEFLEEREKMKITKKELDHYRFMIQEHYKNYFTKEELMILMLYQFYIYPSENKELYPDIILSDELIKLGEEIDDKSKGIIEGKYKHEILEPIDYKVIQIERLLEDNPKAKKSDIANKINVAWNTANKYIGLAEERIRIYNLLLRAFIDNKDRFIVFALFMCYFPEFFQKIQTFSLIH